MMKKLFVAAMMAISAGTAHAATLAGDSVTMTITNAGFGTLTRVYDVGPGLEETGLGQHTIDFDSGLSGDMLYFTVNPGNYSSFASAGNLTTLTFSGLDFSGGHELIGFNVFSAAFPMTVLVTSPNSIQFSFLDGPYSPTSSSFLMGQWVTAAAVPLPAAGLLLLAGIGGLGLAARRKRRAVA